MIYLDNAATTFPKPKEVASAVSLAVECYGGNPGRGGHDFSMRAAEKVFMVRKKVSGFFGSDVNPASVVFTLNCTMALNIAIKGVLKKGDHVITSNLEHNAAIRPIYKLEQQGIVTYDIAKIGATTHATVQAFADLIRGNTKAIVCTYASNVSGAIMPIKEIGELCKARGIVFIVDCAQAAGVVPIDMGKENIDILCAAGHKGLYGISGTGLMIVRNSGSDEILLDTIIEGGTGSQSASLEQPTSLPDRFESGTVNTAGIFSIGAGIDYINSVGIERLFKYELAHCAKVHEALSNCPQIIVYSEAVNTTPIVSFNVANIGSETVVAALNERGFALRGGLHCCPLAHEHYRTSDRGMVRFSPSSFTKATSVDAFIKTILNFAKNNVI